MDDRKYIPRPAVYIDYYDEWLKSRYKSRHLLRRSTHKLEGKLVSMNDIFRAAKVSFKHKGSFFSKKCFVISIDNHVRIGPAIYVFQINLPDSELKAMDIKLRASNVNPHYDWALGIRKRAEKEKTND